MDLLRTPDERFDGLDEHPSPHHRALVTAPDGASAEMAWVQDGPGDGPVVLLLHGEPTWSYLYRRMIPPLVEAGCQVVAPDLVGFGRSDKPAQVGDHTYARHVGWLRSLLVDVLDLHDVTLVGQDWGGLLGLRLVAEEQDRFARVVAANTGLPTGDHPMPDVWWGFRRAVENAPELDVGRLVASGCVRGLAPTDQAAYDAPFPDESYKAGPRAMPLILPTTPDDPATAANRSAWAELSRWTKPFLIAFSDSDPITGPMRPVLARTVPGAAGLAHPTIARAGHFLQEDAGPELAQAVIDLVRTT
ncbi:haloalkane dehalogenase [Rhodococcus antarcticus]|jgi:haloalkane dehalogenase|uniref:Haloalkane dehalogenase n=1 Tax=Rhodococcus antarcticus TaxID=2987751 RepID=A0ABY6P3Y6_9NOCA|nr:haloalkane dehalogenase [Rhodococcus antarcticus]UZJ26209.1 haloalkane dehalogenase [Rhodococcus antarcticus]